jgi:hypothetical protein
VVADLPGMLAKNYCMLQWAAKFHSEHFCILSFIEESDSDKKELYGFLLLSLILNPKHNEIQILDPQKNVSGNAAACSGGCPCHTDGLPEYKDSWSQRGANSFQKL